MAFTYKLEAKTVRPSSPNLPQRCAELGSRRTIAAALGQKLNVTTPAGTEA